MNVAGTGAAPLIVQNFAALTVAFAESGKAGLKVANGERVVLKTKGFSSQPTGNWRLAIV
jgi:hypothetical protein